MLQGTFSLHLNYTLLHESQYNLLIPKLIKLVSMFILNA